MISLLQGNSLDILKTLDDKSVQCCVTSPPYFRQRDYDIEGQIGLEKTLEEYVGKLVEIFHEVRRVLKDDGVLWLNLGDSYAGGAHGNIYGGKQYRNKGSENMPKSIIPAGLKPKDLMGVPWRVAFALQADGWWLRQDIIWNKTNPMPESVTDRCCKSHEYIFLLTKSARYFYDDEAIKEPSAYPNDLHAPRGSVGAWKMDGRPADTNVGRMRDDNSTRKLRSVWTLPVKPFLGAHFATFPPEIPIICIKAGSRPGDTILDPFSGAGTTGYVAERLSRSYIGIELNPEYNEMAKKRIDVVRLSLFDEVTT